LYESLSALTIQIPIIYGTGRVEKIRVANDELDRAIVGTVTVRTSEVQLAISVSVYREH